MNSETVVQAVDLAYIAAGIFACGFLLLMIYTKLDQRKSN